MNQGNFLGQSQQLALHQTLSTQQIQYLKLLQLSTLELNAYLEQLQLENPVVEVEPPAVQSEEGPSALEMVHWLRQTSEIKADEDPADHDADETSLLERQPVDTRYDLWEFVQAQLDVSLDKLEIQLIERLIHSLDENGYLTLSSEQLAKEFGTDSALTDEAIAYLKTLDPPGIGAYNLGEALILQLERQNNYDPILHAIANTFLEELPLGHFQKLAKLLDCTPEYIKECYSIIRTLNPRPCSSFGGTPAVHIIPDVTIEERDGRLVCTYNKQYHASIRVNDSYLALAAEDQNARQYVNRKMSQALWVVKAIDSRRQTIERIVEVLLERQQAFFRSPEGSLSPLRLRDVAEQIGVHESTVSRAIHEKYLQCKGGIYPFKYFFPAMLSTPEDADGIGSHSVKERLRALVAAESPTRPLSDSALVTALAAEGITLARRTVAKYREELLIPSSSLRRIHKNS